MLKRLSLFITLTVALLLTACHKNEQTIKGNGVRQTVARSVPTFQNIVVNGNYDVVLIGQMPQQVQLTEDSNLLAYVTTTVKDNTLYIDTAKDVSISTQQPPMLQIYLPTLKKLVVNGAGQVNATKITADSLDVEVNGSGRFNLSGNVNKFNTVIKGAGEVNAQDLISKQANVDVNGSGRVSVNAVKSLSIKVSGSGSVEYFGTPGDVSQSISGSGRVIGISGNAQKN